MRMKSLTGHCTLATSLFILGGAANGAITYVDASEGSSGNTFATGGSLGTTAWVVPGSSTSNETQWVERINDDFGYDGAVYQGWHSISPDADELPELTTTITGLANGTYDVWAFFWDATGSNAWNLAAGLTSGSLTTYSADGLGDTTSPIASGSLDMDFSGATAPVNPGDRILYGVNLGQASVSGGSSIDVFLDNLTGGGSSNRTWYDGVGYELVIPEPSSATLLALSMVMISRRRRV